MCLRDVKLVDGNGQKGYAFKVVSPIPGTDLYEGKWLRFRQGMGGIGGNTKERDTYRNCVKWKVGRLYRVKHFRTTRGYDGVLYPANVHLYKRYDTALAKSYPYDTILVCWYTSGTHQDDITIVAKRVTPIVALRDNEEKTEFLKILKDVGIKDAILLWHNRF
jgi:hypothetical protein